ARIEYGPPLDIGRTIFDRFPIGLERGYAKEEALPLGGEELMRGENLHGLGGFVHHDVVDPKIVEREVMRRCCRSECIGVQGHADLQILELQILLCVPTDEEEPPVSGRGQIVLAETCYPSTGNERGFDDAREISDSTRCR